MKRRDFLFTVVIVAGNAEDLLRESVESVLAQSAGFEDNIQLVLVGGGAEGIGGGGLGGTGGAEGIGGGGLGGTGGTGGAAGVAEVCAGYRERYPDNVVFVDGGYPGVSAARNAGLAHARGGLVNFLNVGDVWSAESFVAVADFSRRHPEVGVFTTPFYHVKKPKARPLLKGIFSDGSRLVDIVEEFEYAPSQTTSTFMRRSSIGSRRLDEKLSIYEEACFLYELIIEEGCFGLIAEARCDQKGGLLGRPYAEGVVFDRSYYFEVFERYTRHLVPYARKVRPEALFHAQARLFYDLRRRICADEPECLSSAEFEAYKEALVELVKGIDDEILVGSSRVRAHFCLYCYALKYGMSLEDARGKVGLGESSLLLGGVELRSTFTERTVVVQRVSVRGDKMCLEGLFGSVGRKDTTSLDFFYGCDGEERVFPAKLEIADSPTTRTVFGDCTAASKVFEVAIPLSSDGSVTATLKENGFSCPVLFKFSVFTRLTDRISASYFVSGDWLVFARRRGEEGERRGFLEVRRNPDRTMLVKRELRFLFNLFKYRDGAGDAPGRRWIPFRLRYRLAKALRDKKRSIWIVTDKIHYAGDNGEAVFEYLAKHPIEGVDAYFVLADDSADYARLGRIGKVLGWGTRRFYLKYLLADFVISSHSTCANPFGEDAPYVNGLMGRDYVFLQHGILMGDHSNALCRRIRNYRLFVCAAYDEYAAVLAGYGYTAREAQLTGLPRHEKLLKNEAGIRREKVVFIAPTWRKFLANPMDTDELRTPFAGFGDSEYCRFYNRLINDERLLDAMEEHGYRAEFLLHPAIRLETGHFHGNDRAVVLDSVRYEEAFLRSSVMVTDYSSAAVDFALLRKAVVYSQFDQEAFFGGHNYRKGFTGNEGSYIFGPVCTDYEGTLSAIIAAIERDGRMEDRYEQRVEEFFFLPEEDRRKLIVDEILKVKRERI